MTGRGLLAGLAGLTLALAALSTAVGYASLDIGAAFGDWFAGRESLGRIVLVELRLPRAVMGVLVGFSLGIVGAAMQGLLRNPLADPGIIGVSAAAALGAVATFYSGLAATFALALPLGGIGGAFLGTLAIYALAGRRTGTTGLILAGVALSSLCGALTSLALNLSPNPYAALEIIYWLMGSLADRSWQHVALAAPLMAAGWFVTMRAASGLDALTLGEATAESLGFRMRSLRLKVIAGAALAVGSAVAVSGAIGFVGLVAPHVMRPLVRHRPGRLLLVSGLAGAALTVGADIAVRLLPMRPELKLGVVTALIGAPFLLALILRLRRPA
ncbi:FecCD family ABC transporter permease [Acuticoccus sediminis]|uniref:FecCD family ABC transporter permease n=1 Tax=Acuticoccus sediminis TaxID=2184697 RepID=UPI001CFD1B4D|nr:iron ABC transporter permease [Acuticoccus sediminis]